MAEISLKQYLEKLDTHLQDGEYTEAIYHSRHVLKHFPKNISAYRVLSRALLEESRWQQAVDMLRRVLSVAPDEYNAFLGLSQAYERLEKPDEAIWYLERAFEQRPNDRALTQKLRDLYAMHRNQQIEKINLSAGAVARQYRRNGLYDQAIDLLRRTLAKSPERADLRILLVRVHREAEQPIEAAEVAQDVVDQLPDCLEANTLLARVWLAVERPSDAQRHLSRIEPVDSYLALEIVQGEPPDEDSFTLQELDYQQVAARELTASSPDWLSQIDSADSEQFDDDLFDLGDDERIDTPATTTSENDNLPDFDLDSDDDDDDWLNSLEDMDTQLGDAAAPALGATAGSTGLTGLLSALDDEDNADDLDIAPADDMPGDLQVEDFDLFDDDELDDVDDLEFGDFEDDDDLFADSAPPEQDAEAVAASADAPVNLSDDDDPLAWLKDSDVEIVDDDDLPDAPKLPDTGRASDADDPLAWLKESGVDVVEEGEGAELFKPYIDEDDDDYSPPDDEDPMAWLQSSGVEIADEDENDLPIEDDLFGDLSELENADLTAAEDDDDDPLAWLKQSGVEVVDDSAEPQANESSTASEFDEDNEDALDWLADDDALLDEMFDLEALTDSEAGDDGDALDDLPGAVASVDTLETNEASDWQDDMPDKNDENEFSDWFDSEESDFGSELEWMDAEGEPTGESDAPSSGNEQFDDLDDDALDWMSEAEDETGGTDIVEPAMFGDIGAEWSGDDSQDWLESSDEETEEMITSNDMPDWLMDSAPGDADASADKEADTEFAKAMSMDETGEDVPDWLAAVGGDDADDSDDADDLIAESDSPDWLSNFSPESAEATSDEFTADLDTGDDDLFAWDEDEGEDIEAEADAVPDWLAAVGEDYDEPEAEQEAAFADDLVTEDNTPDWLMASAPDDEEDEVEEDAFAMQAKSDDDDDLFAWDEDESEDIEAEADAMPDWLAAVGGDDDDDDDEFEDDLVAEDDTPDWLMASAPDDEEDEVEEDAFAMQAKSGDDDDLFAWDEDESEDIEVEADAVPDWLAAVGEDYDEPEAEQEAAFDDDLVAEEEDAFAMQAESDEEDVFAWDEDDTEAEDADAVPEWLAVVGEDYDEPEAEQEAAFDDDLVAEEDAFAMQADDDEGKTLPEWLMDSAPDDDDEVEEDEFDKQAETNFAKALPDDDEAMFEEDAEPSFAKALADDDVYDDDEEVIPPWLTSAEADYDDEPEAEEDAFVAETVADDAYEDESDEAIPAWLQTPAPDDEMDEMVAESEPEAFVMAESQDAPGDPELAEENEAVPLGDQEGEYVQAGDVDEIALGPQYIGSDDIPEREFLEEIAQEAPAASSLLFEEMRAGIIDENAVAMPTANVESTPPERLNYDTIEDREEEVDPTPADNAPDWLNAMVPGLDVDYEAEEDAQIEQSFVEDGTPHQSADFGWLNDVVEEEMSQPPTLPELPGAPSATPTPTRRRFSFSRPPAWRQSTTQSQQAGDDDDIGEELPPWLDYDDDEF